MAQLTSTVVFLLVFISNSLCKESVVDKNSNLYNDILQVVSHILKNDSDTFSSAAVSILNVVDQGAPPDEEYLIQLDIEDLCHRNSSSGCESLSAVCELVVSGAEDRDLDTQVMEGLRCAQKESHILLPAANRGFITVDTDAEVRDVAEYAIRQLEGGGDQTRNILDIMSVKKESQQSGTRFYLTVKVTAADEGDSSHLEVCELEVNQTSDVTLQCDGSCFPLSAEGGSVPLSEELVLARAQEVAVQLSGSSPSKFLYTCQDVLRAEQSVTPGSEGVMSTYELRLSASVCLKAGVEGMDGGEDRRRCIASNPSTGLTCTVTSWERTWLGDTLYSRPECSLVSDATTVQAVEESTVGFESESQALESRVPVVEQQVVARHVSCLGCPLNLNPGNPALDELVQQALDHVDLHSSSEYLHGLSRITKAQRQIVNGVRYILQIDVMEVSCLKGSGTDRRLCGPRPGSEVMTCLIEFTERPWLGPEKRIDSNNCSQEVNDLDNEIFPEHARRDEAEKQEILDYLDGLDDPYAGKGFGEDTFLQSVVEANPGDVSDRRAEPSVGELRPYLTGHAPGRPATSSVEDEAGFAMDGTSSTEDEDGGESSEAVDDPGTEHGHGGVASGNHVVQASTDRERRNTQVVGDLQDLDESEKHIAAELAQTSVTTLDELDADDNQRVVMKILDAKKQIVNGILYHVTIMVGFTQCKEGTPPRPDCSKDITSRICKVQLHRAFAADDKAKVVQSECGAELEDGHRDRRSAPPVLGGISPADTTDPDIVRAATSAVLLLSSSSTGFSNQPCIDAIQNAQTQVVAGTLVRMTLKLREHSAPGVQSVGLPCPADSKTDVRVCDLEVWERLWLNETQVTNVSCRPEASSRSRRGLLVGGRSPASVQDHNVQRLATLAVAHLARTSGSSGKVLVHVLSAEKQVVAGIKWYITFTVSEQGSQQEQQETCEVQIVEQAWRNITDIISLTCSPSAATTTTQEPGASLSRERRATSRGGGGSALYSRDVEEAARFALSQLDHTTTSTNTQFLVQVNEAHIQVVDGDQLYVLLVEVAESTCPKNSTYAQSSCQRLRDVPSRVCHVDVLVRRGELSEGRQLVGSVCGPADTVSQHVQDTLGNSVQRFKRSLSALPGGWVQSEPSGAYIQELASFVTSQLDVTSGSQYAMKHVRVVDSRTQMVSGKLVQLTLEVGLSNCLKDDSTRSGADLCELKSDSEVQVCKAEVWDQAWRNHRELKSVSCGPQHSVHHVKKRSAAKHVDLVGKFEKFMSRWNKSYSSKAEYKRRYRIFRANMKKVELLQETERGTAKYGATQFADLTAKEFRRQYLGLVVKQRDGNAPALPVARVSDMDVELPSQFDWRHYNAVTPVKNQGSCGSCWAFSVTGNVEGQWAISKGKLLSLSEQELVDCDHMDSGCGGGEMVSAYEAIQQLGGLETEGEYPYEGYGDNCHFNKSEVRATISGAVNISSNETLMARWLVNNGPISIGINANAMQFYFGGVSHPWKILCNPDDLDHGVLIVGYGVHETKYLHKMLPYWIVKNSWGPSWGEKGYYRVFRGDGTCGVNQMATSAIVV